MLSRWISPLEAAPRGGRVAADRRSAAHNPTPHNDGQGRAIPPGAAHRVPHRPGLASLEAAQAELDAWVTESQPPPADRFLHAVPALVTSLRPATMTAGSTTPPDPGRGDGYWVARRASRTGVVCMNWQQVCLGTTAAGRNIDVWVTDTILQFFDHDQLLRTQTRNQPGQVRKKKSSVPGGQPP